jgi:hypothetical protein
MCLPKHGHVARAPAIKSITNKFSLITMYQKNFGETPQKFKSFYLLGQIPIFVRTR